MKIYVMRHGLSESNKKFTYSSEDTRLADEAKEQLLPVAKMLQKINFDEVYSSELLRARNSAEILGFNNVITDKRINERDFGVFIGKTHEECLRDLSFEYSSYQRDPIGYKIPDGESYHDVCSRVWSFLDEISEKERLSNNPIMNFRPAPGDDRNIMVVAHFNVITACACWVLDNVNFARNITIDNGGVLVIEIRGAYKMIYFEREGKLE